MMRRFTASALVLLTLVSCAPRELLLPVFGIEPPTLNGFPPDFEPPLSPETDLPMSGFGGAGGGLTRTPILFIHGNIESARFWLPARRAFIDEGWTQDELWAFGYGWNSVRWFDGNDLSAPAIGRMVDAMTAYLSRKSGREVRQVDIVAHSLGVTAVRQWMKQDNAWHRVRNLIAVAGANHGVWTARSDGRGQNRVTSLELAPGSPWLEQLNRGNEIPGPTRYMTLYDGTGRGDVLFPAPLEHSPALQGATNLAFNLERETYLDHLELPRVPQTVHAMAEFLRAAGEPLPQSAPPRLLRTGDRLHAEPTSARVVCADKARDPDRTLPQLADLQLTPGDVTSCYATDPHSGQVSAMQRLIGATGIAMPSAQAPALTVDPPAGVYANALHVRLQASDPAAMIVYTTTGAAPQTGSPLYAEPVFIASPLILRAVAIAPDGQRSEELTLRYDISLERLEAEHSLQRQLEPDAPIDPTRTRRKGR